MVVHADGISSYAVRVGVKSTQAQQTEVAAQIQFALACEIDTAIISSTCSVIRIELRLQNKASLQAIAQIFSATEADERRVRN